MRWQSTGHGTGSTVVPFSALALSLVHAGFLRRAEDSPYLERYCEVARRHSEQKTGGGALLRFHARTTGGGGRPRRREIRWCKHVHRHSRRHQDRVRDPGQRCTFARQGEVNGHACCPRAGQRPRPGLSRGQCDAWAHGVLKGPHAAKYGGSTRRVRRERHHRSTRTFVAMSPTKTLVPYSLADIVAVASVRLLTCTRDPSEKEEAFPR